MAPRESTDGKARLLDFLLERARSRGLAVEMPIGFQIEVMDDGGMGSFRIDAPSLEKNRVYAATASECSFLDSDGVEVICSLYMDKNGMPLEVDVWKTDYSQLQVIPMTFGETKGGETKG